MKCFFSIAAAIVLGMASIEISSGLEHPKGVKVTFPQFPASAHLYGPKIKASDLKGKVVFFEYWGINCPPCIASFPHLVKLYDQYKSKGLVIPATVKGHRIKSNLS
jgi:thiol-disulfide isomerase/thioredoxin